MLIRPKLAVLDTSTLAKISKDYWSANGSEREKARLLLHQFEQSSVYVAISLTHVIEFFRHENDEEVDNRFRFLRHLKLLAWIRPYDRTWFPGSVFDVILREAHAYCSDVIHSWPELIKKVREELWETGVGEDMFQHNPELWQLVRKISQARLHEDKIVASLARSNATQVDHLKFSDVAHSAVASTRSQKANVEHFT